MGENTACAVGVAGDPGPGARAAGPGRAVSAVDGDMVGDTLLELLLDVAVDAVALGLLAKSVCFDTATGMDVVGPVTFMRGGIDMATEAADVIGDDNAAV